MVQGPPLELLELPQTTGPNAIMRSLDTRDTGPVIRAEVVANRYVRTASTMTATHVSSAVINFPDAALAEEEVGEMVCRPVLQGGVLLSAHLFLG